MPVCNCNICIFDICSLLLRARTLTLLHQMSEILSLHRLAHGHSEMLSYMYEDVK